MKTRIFLIICLITGIAVHLSANEKIYINREVTTHIVMPENIKMVDISTTKIIGRTSVGQREDIHQPGSDHAHCNAGEHQNGGYFHY